MANSERIASGGLRRKLAAYSLATGSGLIAMDSADAAVVLFQPPAPLVYDITFSPLSDVLDINEDGFLDFYISGNYEYNGYLGRNQGAFSLEGYLGINQIFASSTGGFYLATLFAPGETIGAGLSVNDAELDHFTQARGYVGVVFDIPGGSPHYGYLDAEISGADNFVLTIHGGGYESQANTPLRAGNVPEPTGLALLASGAAGLGVWRRRNS